jgi:transposase, IS30 family
MHYSRLSLSEREEISRSLAMGISIRAIAKSLQRSPSSVCREINRFGERNIYRAASGERHARLKASNRRGGKRKIVLNPKLLKAIKIKLRKFWSPEQIARFLKIHYKCSSMHVSAESIYSYIYVFLRRELKQEFANQLRHAHKKRKKQGQIYKGRSTGIQDMVSIDERPQEVHDRLIPGHWEGDLIIGGSKQQSALGTLVERKTRYAILVPLKTRSSEEVRKKFAREIMKLPKELRLSLTYDQGKEMSQHLLFTKDTKMQVYFAHPQSPWERGTNENTNGLLRQYFPKGTDFRNISTREIKRAQRSLNGRPRKTLDWKTPHEVMQELLR